MTTNKVSLSSDGIIHCQFTGDQTPAAVDEATKLVRKQVAALRRTGQPMIILIDITTVGEGRGAVRKKGGEVLRQLKYDKIAIHCGNRIDEVTVNFIIAAVGKKDSVRAFLKRGQALRWLKHM